MTTGAKPIALTMGDPAGVGLEITAKAWASRTAKSAFFLIGDPAAARAAGAQVAVIGRAAEALEAFSDALPVLPESLATPPVAGAPAPENASAVVRSIEAAARMSLTGEAAAVVTNPINKKALYDGAGFEHPGHTEFLGALAGAARTVMMLSAPGLRVVPATIHIPLADVAKRLTTELIEETGRVLAASLTRDFDIARPRIAVAGLNPHAGEGGAMGYEDRDIIAPAIRAMRAEGIDAFGPLPADTMFHPKARAGYDAALCMYHDQALIPVKMLDFARGVNVTLGLPFVRTSPDHGTAYDIAGTGAADPTSLIEALNLASAMSGRRAFP